MGIEEERVTGNRDELMDAHHMMHADDLVYNWFHQVKLPCLLQS